MKRIKTVALGALIAALAAGALATPASAATPIKQLAKAECKEEKLTEPAEFAALYGGTDRAAMKECVKSQRREARADCVQDRAEEPTEFAAEYGGTDPAAIKRCMRDELI